MKKQEWLFSNKIKQSRDQKNPDVVFQSPDKQNIKISSLQLLLGPLVYLNNDLSDSTHRVQRVTPNVRSPVSCSEHRTTFDSSKTFHTTSKQKKINNDQKKFIQMQHFFSTVGPSRSKKTIEAKAIVLNKPMMNNTNPIKINQIKLQCPSPLDFKFITNTPSVSNQYPSARARTAKIILSKSHLTSSLMFRSTSEKCDDSLGEQKIKTANHSIRSPSMYKFIHQISQINTQEKLNSKTKYLRIKTTKIQHFSISANKNDKFVEKNYPRSLREVIIDRGQLARHLNTEDDSRYDEKIANEQERQKFGQFLQNNWIKKCISSQSLRDYGKFVIGPQDLQEQGTNKDILENDLKVQTRNNFKNLTRLRGQHKMNYQSTPTNLELTTKNQDTDQRQVYMNLKQYMGKKQLQVKRDSIALKDQISIYNEAHWKMAKRKDEEDLIQFDPQYKLKVNLRRFRNKIKFLIKHSQQLKLSILELLDRKIINFRPYESRGSYAFIKYAKMGFNQFLIKLLQENNNLIYEFDELQRNALHWAVLKGQVETVKILLQYEADPKNYDMMGCSPFQYAIKSQNIQITKIFLEIYVPNDIEYLHTKKYCKSALFRTMLKITKMKEIQTRVQSIKLKLYLQLLILKIKK